MIMSSTRVWRISKPDVDEPLNIWMSSAVTEHMNDFQLWLKLCIITRLWLTWVLRDYELEIVIIIADEHPVSSTRAWMISKPDVDEQLKWPSYVAGVYTN